MRYKSQTSSVLILGALAAALVSAISYMTMAPIGVSTETAATPAQWKKLCSLGSHACSLVGDTDGATTNNACGNGKCYA
jgi:hypothetical protein